MRGLNRSSAAIAASVLLLALAAAPRAAADEAPGATVGLLADLTGSGAPNGRSCREGYEVARVAAPAKVSFLYGDHKGEAKTGLAEFARMTGAGGAIAI